MGAMQLGLQPRTPTPGTEAAMASNDDLSVCPGRGGGGGAVQSSQEPLKGLPNFPKCKTSSSLEPVMPLKSPALLPLGGRRSWRGTCRLFYSRVARHFSFPIIFSLRSLPLLPFLLSLYLSLLYNLTILEPSRNGSIG